MNTNDLMSALLYALDTDVPVELLPITLLSRAGYMTGLLSDEMMND